MQFIVTLFLILLSSPCLAFNCSIQAAISSQNTSAWKHAPQWVEAGGGWINNPTLGAELFNVNAAAFTSGTYGWNGYTNTIANVSSALQITYVSNSAGAIEYLNATDAAALTVGNWYRYAMDVMVSSGGSVSWNLRTSNASGVTLAQPSFTNTTPVRKTANFRADGTADAYVNFASMGAGEIVTVDNLSLKALPGLAGLINTRNEGMADGTITVRLESTTRGEQYGIWCRSNAEYPATPTSGLLVMLAGDGYIRAYTLSGTTWSVASGFTATAQTSATGNYLRVVLSGTTAQVFFSTDSGVTFTQISGNITLPSATGNIHGLFSTGTTTALTNYTFAMPALTYTSFPILPFAVLVGDNDPVSPNRTAANISKHDIVLTQDFAYDDAGATWSAVKALNPASKFFAYVAGEIINITSNCASIPGGLDNIGRYSSACGHSQGTLSTHLNTTPSYFLKDAGGTVIYNTNSPNYYIMDVGVPGLQQYWVEATTTDMNGRAWQPDGVFTDWTYPLLTAQSSVDPDYTTDALWADAVISFVDAVTGGLAGAAPSLLYVPNIGCASSDVGSAAWISMDGNAHPPYAGLDEAIFVQDGGCGTVRTNGTQGVYVLPPVRWIYSLNVLSQTSNIRVLGQNRTCNGYGPGSAMVDQYDHVRTWDDLLISSLAYYFLGQNANGIRDRWRFQEGSDYNWMDSAAPYWHAEYDYLDLGRPLEDYHLVSGQTDVYMREYERGYVYASISYTVDRSIALPVDCKKITHANVSNDWNSLATITADTLTPMSGAIYAKNSMLNATKLPELGGQR